MLKIACAFAIAMTAASAFAADIGASIHAGEPGYYGRVDIGAVTQPPRLIRAQPVFIQRPPIGSAPIYLRVRPGHERYWSNHCREYNACNRPVYFVKDDWYQEQYVARPRGEDRRDEKSRANDEKAKGSGDERRDEKGRARGDERRDERSRGRDDDRRAEQDRARGDNRR